MPAQRCPANKTLHACSLATLPALESFLQPKVCAVVSEATQQAPKCLRCWFCFVLLTMASPVTAPIVASTQLQAKRRVVVPEANTGCGIEDDCYTDRKYVSVCLHLDDDHIVEGSVERQVEGVQDGFVLDLHDAEGYTRPDEVSDINVDRYHITLQNLLKYLKKYKKKPTMVLVQSQLFKSVQATVELIKIAEFSEVNDWVIFPYHHNEIDENTYLGLHHFGNAVSSGRVAMKTLCFRYRYARDLENFLPYLSGAGAAPDLEMLTLVTPNHREGRMATLDTYDSLVPLLHLLKPNKIFGKVPTVLLLGTRLGMMGYLNLKDLAKQLCDNYVGNNLVVPLLLVSALSVKGFDKFGHLLPEIDNVVLPAFDEGEKAYVSLPVPDKQVQGHALEDSETRIYSFVPEIDGPNKVAFSEFFRRQNISRLQDMLRYMDKKRAVACRDNRNRISDEEIESVVTAYQELNPFRDNRRRYAASGESTGTARVVRRRSSRSA